MTGGNLSEKKTTAPNVRVAADCHRRWNHTKSTVCPKRVAAGSSWQGTDFSGWHSRHQQACQLLPTYSLFLSPGAKRLQQNYLPPGRSGGYDIIRWGQRTVCLVTGTSRRKRKHPLADEPPKYPTQQYISLPDTDNTLWCTPLHHLTSLLLRSIQSEWTSSLTGNLG